MAARGRVDRPFASNRDDLYWEDPKIISAKGPIKGAFVEPEAGAVYIPGFSLSIPVKKLCAA